MKKVLRGEIYYAELDPVIGSEQGGIRPVVILQDNKGTINCPTCIVAPLTKLINKKFYMKSHVYIKPRHYLKHDSVVLLEHTRAISKDRLRQYIAKISPKEQSSINRAILNTFGLVDKENKMYEKKNI
jgi:mRNA interferase MazF